MALDLGLVEEQPHLANAPLQTVICQLRFPKLLGMSDADVRPLQRALSGEYPLTEEARTTQAVVNPDGELVPTGDIEPVYRFRDPERQWMVAVLPTAISLEVGAGYRDFRDFLQRWFDVVNAATDTLGVTRQERLGLRYVNALEAPASPTANDLGSLVRTELVGIVGGHAQTERLISSSNELRFQQPEGEVCTFRHGYIASDNEAAYMLDFDWYDPVPCELNIDKQVKALARFNHGIYALFRWSVSDEAFESFLPKAVSG